MLKYEQIAKEIQNYINDNNLLQGSKLPTVEELAQQYVVSKTTIVKALEKLTLNGVVYQVRGSGTFVRRKQQNNYIDLTIMNGLTSNLNDNTHQITSKVIEFKCDVMDENMATLLESSPEEEVYIVKRIRYINKKIMCYEESYYKKSIVPFLTKEIASGSIFEYLTTALGLNLGFSDSYIHIENLTPDIANLLELQPHDPAMIFFQQLYLASGSIFNVTKLTYHYQNTQFYLQSSSIKTQKNKA